MTGSDDVTPRQGPSWLIPPAGAQPRRWPVDGHTADDGTTVCDDHSRPYADCRTCNPR
ncbi:hypothetical protein [Saccharothrix lopnurensis]|uniref:Uncharacterized protein n=1 Tax=Saccharothrix lopnurensis TaxID=1670621 RepID=A0ABW1PIC1_9PSEU